MWWASATLRLPKNGIYYYDRRPKFDTARLKAIFEKIPSTIENPQDLSDWK